MGIGFTKLLIKASNITARDILYTIVTSPLRAISRNPPTLESLINNGAEMPIDILVDILSRLPADSILRSKCVCKQWCSLIESPFFYNYHKDQIKTRDSDGFIHVLERYNDHLSFSLITEKFGLLTEYLPPISASTDPLTSHIASCDGLLCCLEYDNNHIKVCNPITQEVIALPKPCCFEEPWKNFQIGLGFDKDTENYKIVCWPVPNFDRKIEVITLGSNSWRTIRTGKLQINSIPFTSRPVYFNGAVHWLNNYAIEWEVKKSEWVLGIIAFKLADEKLQQLRGPGLNVHNRYWLCELRGHLCVVCRKVRNDKVMHYWLLKDYEKQEWVKERLVLPKKPTEWWCPVATQSGGVLIRLRGNVFIHICRYNSKGELIRRTRFFLPQVDATLIDTHLESLVSLRSLHKSFAVNTERPALHAEEQCLI